MASSESTTFDARTEFDRQAEILVERGMQQLVEARRATAAQLEENMPQHYVINDQLDADLAELFNAPGGKHQTTAVLFQILRVLRADRAEQTAGGTEDVTVTTVPKP